MKKYTLLFLLIFAIGKINAQNYSISFAGIGASTTVDSVKVENLTQCTDTILSGGDTLHLIETSTGINGLNTDADKNLLIYPNPMTGICMINFETTIQGKITLILYDITGKIVLQVQELLLKGHHTYSLSGINNGVYFLKVKSDNYSKTAKIVCSGLSNNNPELTHIETMPRINKKNTTTDSDKSLIQMQYNTGDTLKLTGKSGIYRTVYMLIPTQSQTVTFNFVACTDTDGNNYSVVQIGTQIWMAENLKTTKYNNGNTIPLIMDNATWANLSTPGYCWYNNDSVINKKIYGALYNWHTVNTGILAPTGWHVPSNTEFWALINFLGGESITGGKLKETCAMLWHGATDGVTNITGFTLLPSGERHFINGAFQNLGYSQQLLSTTESSNTLKAWSLYLTYNNLEGWMDDDYKTDGFSVRCVKD